MFPFTPHTIIRLGFWPGRFFGFLLIERGGQVGVLAAQHDACPGIYFY